MEPLQRHYKPLQSHYESLLSRYGTVTSNYQTLRAVTALDGSKEPVPYSGGRSGPQPSSEGLAPWVVPSAPLPQRDSLWLAHSAHVCGRLRGGEVGRQPASWSHYSTLVLILQVGGGRGTFLARPASTGAAMGPLVAEAVVPPSPPSNVFEYRGDTPCSPGGGCALCTLSEGTGIGRLLACSQGTGGLGWGQLCQLAVHMATKLRVQVGQVHAPHQPVLEWMWGERQEEGSRFVWQRIIAVVCPPVKNSIFGLGRVRVRRRNRRQGRPRRGG